VPPLQTQNQEQSKSKTHGGGCAAPIESSVARNPTGLRVAHEARPAAARGEWLGITPKENLMSINDNTRNNPPSNHQPTTVMLTLPSVFIELCQGHQVQPGTVLQGFIADLCGLNEPEAGFVCNGEQAGDLARWYYAQVGYAWWPR
jgi:hypothetical protein